MQEYNNLQAFKHCRYMFIKNPWWLLILSKGKAKLLLQIYAVTIEQFLEVYTSASKSSMTETYM